MEESPGSAAICWAPRGEDVAGVYDRPGPPEGGRGRVHRGGLHFRGSVADGLLGLRAMGCSWRHTPNSGASRTAETR
jgi:hypothetical protein